MWAPGIGIRHRIRKPTVARTEQSGSIFLLESDNCTYSPKLAAVLTVLLWHLLSHEVDSPSRSVCPVSPRPTKDAQHCTVPRGFSSHSILLPRTPHLLQAEAKVLHPPPSTGSFSNSTYLRRVSKSHLVILTQFQAFSLPSYYGELDDTIAIVLGNHSPHGSKTVDSIYKRVSSADLLAGHSLNLLLLLTLETQQY